MTHTDLENHSDHLPVVFFVTLPSETKGMTGAVIGTRTVINAVSQATKVSVVEVLHRKIRLAGAQISWRAGLQYIKDYKASRQNLMDALDGQGTSPFVLYLCVASSLVGGLRDAATMRYVRRRFPHCHFALHTRNGDFFFPKSAFLKSLRRWQLSQAYRMICLSHRLLPSAQDLLHILPQEAHSRIRVVPNTIDADLIASPEELAVKAGKTGPITVLYLSNFIPSKGYLKLGEAIQIIAKAGRLQEFRFVFRGTWPNQSLFEEFEASFSPDILASGAVDIGHGIWDREAVRAALLEADVFCLPTSYPAEAQPRSILEGMACGCSILANDHASIADLVESGETGFIAKDISPQDMADFLMAQSRTDIAEQGQRGRVKFDEQFSRAAHDESIREAIL